MRLYLTATMGFGRLITLAHNHPTDGVPLFDFVQATTFIARTPAVVLLGKTILKISLSRRSLPLFALRACTLDPHLDTKT